MSGCGDVCFRPAGCELGFGVMGSFEVEMFAASLQPLRHAREKGAHVFAAVLPRFRKKPKVRLSQKESL